ncbi:MAG: hypothetical protein JSW71_19465 [Gemmatimonadota bacterium]|nr:MAG: hypothetical protein JSW71_19465 [Gemmatimonadota bacterium]
MPLTYTIDRDSRFVTAVASGRLESGQALTMFDEIMSQVDPGVGMKLLSDHRTLESVMPTEFVVSMVRRVQANPEVFAGARWAFVESGEARYGMARMASLLLERSPVDLQVFRDVDEARAWLQSEETEHGS